MSKPVPIQLKYNWYDPESRCGKKSSANVSLPSPVLVPFVNLLTGTFVVEITSVDYSWS